MKINNLQGTQNIGKAEQKNAKPISGADFSQLLETQLQAVSASSGMATVASTEALQVSPALRIESLSLAEATINSLDSFGTALKTLSLSSESLLPFVESLEEETSSLLTLKEQLPEGDPLATLLDRVASVSYVEAAKFRRGDYQ
ncbi:MAG: hypothetical protein V1706_07615 [Pseudomonadota bacterium]